ncbi:hypothetical protein l11_14550 [Neisseria weaveri LMG 5135]|nr:hypothetical protein l11_14550 [Neisseria weaveri LMG 5135]
MSGRGLFVLMNQSFVKKRHGDPDRPFVFVVTGRRKAAMD